MLLESKTLRNGELLTLETLSRPLQGKPFVLVWQTPARAGRKATILDQVYFYDLPIAQNRFERTV